MDLTAPKVEQPKGFLQLIQERQGKPVARTKPIKEREVVPEVPKTQVKILEDALKGMNLPSSEEVEEGKPPDEDDDDWK
jgi:hypothetical protein